MAESSIEWTNLTWNPTTGCSSAGIECNFCYARKETNRLMHNPKQPKYKAGFDVVVEHPDSLQEPFTWKKPQTVFVNSMSDLFHKDISLEFIKKVFEVMNKTPQHTYQVLTKRHQNLEKYSKDLTWTDNIWMGVSVGTQIAKRRIDSLRKCDAKNKFLSVEPLIEDLGELNLSGIDLVFVGGESGANDVRPMKKEWVNNVKDACEKSKTAFFFKQWGKSRNNPNPDDPTIDANHRYHAKGGCMLDGKLYLDNPSVSDDTVPKIKLFDDEYLMIDEKCGLKTIWELQSYLPQMEKELFDQLKESIRKNGLIDPILFYKTKQGEKLVIEGHTRFSAAISLKLKEIPSKEIKEDFQSLDDIKFWIVKHQIQRRNLTKIEKLEYAYLFKESIENKGKENLSKAGKGEKINEKIDTYSEIAKLAGISRPTVQRYEGVLSNAPKSVIEKMRIGDLSISGAYKSVEKKKNRKAEKTVKPVELSYVMVDSIESAKEKMKNGDLEMILMVEKKKFEQGIPRLSKKMGVFIFE